MAKGRAHDRLNLLIGSVCSGVLIGIEKNWPITFGFVLGFLLSTLVLSPDLDLGPKKRAGIFRIILYPYSVFFKHRGYSHSLLFGTLTRVFYGIAVVLFIIFCSHKMGYLKVNALQSVELIVNYLKNYNYDLSTYKLLTWTFLGMFLADLLHISIDLISSRFKRLF